MGFLSEIMQQLSDEVESLKQRILDKQKKKGNNKLYPQNVLEGNYRPFSGSFSGKSLKISERKETSLKKDYKD